MKIESIASCLSNKLLSLTIMPTEQCNFRCSYCYEDFSIGKMQRDIIDGIKKLISVRAPELDFLHIEWFGGEPLIARDIIKEISQHIQGLKRVHGFRYQAGMTTNGFQLTGQTMVKLLSYGIRSYQISLDGQKATHDSTRKRIDGSGSFDKIWNNLIAAKRINDDFKIMLRLHVTPDNYSDLRFLTQIIRDEFYTDKRFGIFFKAIENLGGANAGTFKTLTGISKTEVMANLKALLPAEQNFSPLDKPEPYICYASKPNHLVIRANGTIAKCTVAFSDMRNNIGKIDKNGKLSIDPSKLTLWTRGIKSQNLSELECPAYQLPKQPPMRSINRQLQSIPITVTSTQP